LHFAPHLLGPRLRFAVLPRTGLPFLWLPLCTVAGPTPGPCRTLSGCAALRLMDSMLAWFYGSARATHRIPCSRFVRLFFGFGPRIARLRFCVRHARVTVCTFNIAFNTAFRYYHGCCPLPHGARTHPRILHFGWTTAWFPRDRVRLQQTTILHTADAARTFCCSWFWFCAIRPYRPCLHVHVGPSVGPAPVARTRWFRLLPFHSGLTLHFPPAVLPPFLQPLRILRYARTVCHWFGLIRAMVLVWFIRWCGWLPLLRPDAGLFRLLRIRLVYTEIHAAVCHLSHARTRRTFVAVCRALYRRATLCTVRFYAGSLRRLRCPGCAVPVNFTVPLTFAATPSHARIYFRFHCSIYAGSPAATTAAVPHTYHLYLHSVASFTVCWVPCVVYSRTRRHTDAPLPGCMH